MAIDQEPGINQEQIDTWLRVAKINTIRNASVGFGNGGVFAEGDGTGSMATYISFLSSLQAWRNVKGLDMVNNGRPNIPMMTLKWLYMTQVKESEALARIDGAPLVGTESGFSTPFAANTKHNVWGRDGLSGSGYFAHGFGALLPEQQSAWRWFYDHSFAKIDQALGMPYDTVSIYPHLSVSSFINWPLDQEPVNPAEVLPKIYVDSEAGFIAGRSSWGKPTDFVFLGAAQRCQIWLYDAKE